jgi:hypothetical protein
MRLCLGLIGTNKYNHMKQITFLIYLFLFLPNVALSKTMNDSVEIYLLNQLDDPRGYCIDIRGYKLKAKINRGLQAHTCYSYQGEISVDQGFDSFKLTKNQFFMPSFDVCMKASSIIASANLKLGKCDYSKLQKFEWSNKGKIHPISNKKLCLTVNQGQSKQGGGGTPVHLMRNLSLELCTNSLKPFQIWGMRRA